MKSVAIALLLGVAVAESTAQIVTDSIVRHDTENNAFVKVNT
jgi:hypothetical protein